MTDRTAIFLVVASLLLIVTIGMLSVACDPPDDIKPNNYGDDENEI